MEKPRIRLIFRFKGFFEALLLNQYQSIGLTKNINGYSVRSSCFYEYDEVKDFSQAYILNKTNGKSHSR